MSLYKQSPKRPTSPAPCRRLRPFLPDRKLPQEQEFMVVGASEPRLYLRQWNSGARLSQEFHFSTRLDCRVLEYRNLTYLQIMQPFALQVHLRLHLGHLAAAFIFKATYNQFICQKREKLYIAVCTVRMFIEPSAKHQQLLS